MFENYNETELLSLMLNKDEFILYITQQYNKNVCCTPLEPIIWAVHFNIPKFQRLPLLENILLQSMAYIKKCYSFLPDKQILGKTYEVLGIPTVCGEPNKCFLNAYKKYKPYYPVRYPKNQKTPLLCNVIHNSTGINPGTKYSKINSTASLLDLEIICSTPNTKKVLSFEVNQLLSPIKTPVNEESQIWPTDSYYDKNNVLNIQNITPNNIVSDNKQIETLPRTLEQSGLDILNTSQQILSSQNGDISKINYSNNTQSEIHFISRDPKYCSYDNDISESDMSSLSNVYSQESYNKKENECRSTNSVYFENNLKKQSILIKKKKTSVVLKQSLSKKIKKNSSYLQKNSWLRKLITSPSIDTKTSNLKQIKSNTQKSILESVDMAKKTFNDISFYDFDEISQTQKTMKHNQGKNMYHNVTEHDSISVEYSATQDSCNVESQNNNREEDSISSVNSSPKVYSYSENHKMYKSNKSNSSLLTFSDTSILNSTISSNKLVSIENKFINWSQDSSSLNGYKENYITHNYDNVIHNITLSEDIWTSQENITMNFSSENHTLLSSTTNTLAYISNFEEDSE